MNMNIPETEKRKLPVSRADDSEDEDPSEDDMEDDAEDGEGEDNMKRCEAGLQSLSTEDCEGGSGSAKEDTLDEADLACGASDDCAEEDDEESDDSSQQGSPSRSPPKRRGRSSASVCSSTSVLGPTRSEEIQGRMRREMRRKKAKEDARQLRKGAKSARNSKMRRDNMNDIKTSMSSVWF